MDNKVNNIDNINNEIVDKIIPLNDIYFSELSAVIQHKFNLERDTHPNFKYFTFQNITPLYRAKILHLFQKICNQRELTRKTYHMSINYFDRMLSFNRYPLSYIKDVAISCLYLASKIEDKYCLDLEDICSSIAELPSKQIIDAEQHILENIGDKLNIFTVYDWLLILLKILIDRIEATLDTNSKIKLTSQYLFDKSIVLLDIITCNPDNLRYYPSALATTTIILIYIPNLDNKYHEYCINFLEKITEYTMDSLKQCIDFQNQYISKIKLYESCFSSNTNTPYYIQSIYNDIYKEIIFQDIQKETRTLSNSPNLFYITDKLEKFELIGKGTYGYVYRGINKTTNQSIAIKYPAKNEKELSLSFAREIAMLTTLNKCENIVKLLGFQKQRQEKNEMYCLVYEYADMDLKAYIDTNRINKPREIIYQILKAISECHQHGIIHRDIKPQNILVFKKNNQLLVKLADFGYSRIERPIPIEYTQEYGTLWYRPPEIMLGDIKQTEKLEVWSLACLFFEIINNQPLFPGDSEVDQLFRIFRLLGTPNENNWPNATKLPYFKKEYPIWQPKSFRNTFSQLKDPLLDLLKNMLVLDPDKRITISDALKHDYFKDFRNDKKEISVPKTIPIEK